MQHLTILINSEKAMVVGTRRSNLPLSPPPADDSSVSSNYTSSTDGQRGLSEFLQKTLAIDIEKSGGIKNLTQPDSTNGKFSKTLQRLLDNRPDTYGKKGDPRRTQIQKKVLRWKKLPSDEYAAVLNQLQVKSFATLLFEEKTKKNLLPKKKDESISSSSSNDDSESISSDDASVVSNKEDRKSRPPPQVIGISQPLTPPRRQPVPKHQETIMFSSSRSITSKSTPSKKTPSKKTPSKSDMLSMTKSTPARVLFPGK